MSELGLSMANAFDQLKRIKVRPDVLQSLLGLGLDVWPGQKAGARRRRRVPVTPQARTLLDELEPLTGESVWVFASQRKKGSHIKHIKTVRHAAQRCAKTAGLENFTAHDLRRMAASHMTSMGISRLVVSKILNHAESGITAVYDRHSYKAEKREALLRWAGRLNEILSGGREATTVPKILTSEVPRR